MTASKLLLAVLDLRGRWRRLHEVYTLINERLEGTDTRDCRIGNVIVGSATHLLRSSNSATMVANCHTDSRV